MLNVHVFQGVVPGFAGEGGDGEQRVQHYNGGLGTGANLIMSIRAACQGAGSRGAKDAKK